MIPKLMLLDPKKRQQVISAALEEFAQKGYRHTSTNEIVRKAHIAKRLLFHFLPQVAIFLDQPVICLFELSVPHLCHGQSFRRVLLSPTVRGCPS